MDPDEKRPPEGCWSKDTVLVQFTAEMLPPESPEFQERAKLPLSKRGPFMQLFVELAKAKGEQPPTE
jgi:hypothetical protein